jgi:phosphoglycerate dehydrogenase-like enzyme
LCRARLASRLYIPFVQSTPSSNTRPGINVSNTPGAVDDATAATALYLILSTLRHFSKAERSLHAGTWEKPISPGDTHDLTTRTLGILGLGGIGLRLAHLAHAFPMRVLYYNRHRVAGAPEWCEYVESMQELCARSDVLSVHVPLREDTVHLVGEREISAMKRGSVIVNTARGKVVDEEAMIRALEAGHVRSFLPCPTRPSGMCFVLNPPVGDSCPRLDSTFTPTNPPSTRACSPSHKTPSFRTWGRRTRIHNARWKSVRSPI